jgi:hypothetical protein
MEARLTKAEKEEIERMKVLVFRFQICEALLFSRKLTLAFASEKLMG